MILGKTDLDVDLRQNPIDFGCCSCETKVRCHRHGQGGDPAGELAGRKTP